MDDRNKTIDKINKLLQLAAKNPNSSEAQIAQTKAFQLMTDNNILINEVIMPGTEQEKASSYNNYQDYQASQEAEYQRQQQDKWNAYYQQQYQKQKQAEAAYQQQQTAADNTSTKFAFGFIAAIGFTLLVLAYIFPTQAKIIMAIGVLMLLVTYWHIALAIGFLYVIFTYF